MLRLVRGWSIFEVLELVSAQTCGAWIMLAEELGMRPAPIYTGAGPELDQRLRECAEVSLPGHAIAHQLTLAITTRLERSPLATGFSHVGEQVRLCRYQPGDYFVPHRDHTLREQDAQSLFTLLIYLSDGFVGGETRFLLPDGPLQVTPERGKALCFEHELVHEGMLMEQGTKYVLRADLFFSA